MKFKIIHFVEPLQSYNHLTSYNKLSVFFLFPGTDNFPSPPAKEIPSLLSMSSSWGPPPAPPVPGSSNIPNMNQSYGHWPPSNNAGPQYPPMNFAPPMPPGVPSSLILSGPPPPPPPLP